MKFYFIFIPDKDASWEIKPNAFQEPQQRPRLCEFGKGTGTGRHDHSKLILCKLCRSFGAHKKGWTTPIHICSICIGIKNPSNNIESIISYVDALLVETTDEI